MFDLSISGNGDINITKNDISVVKGDDLKFQKALCSLMSVTEDWFSNKTFGANLEEIVGLPCDEISAKLGKNKIITSLIKDGAYNQDDIYVDFKLDRTKVQYNIYLRNENRLSSKIIILNLDLVMGCNIKIGGDGFSGNNI